MKTPRQPITDTELKTASGQDIKEHMSFLSKIHGHKGKSKHSHGQAGGPVQTHHHPNSRRGRRILKRLMAKKNRKKKLGEMGLC